MPRKAHKYHYIYKITNLKNNKYYIGMHSTSNLDDGYMGGGTRIRNSIRKHGKEVHLKEILEYLSDRKSLAAKEKEIVNEDLLKDPLCMNLSVGGLINFNTELLKEYSRRGKEKMRWLRDNDTAWREKTKKNRSNGRKRSIENGINNPFDWTGKKHTQETKDKMSKADRTGKKNSQFGTCWITHPELGNKKVKKDFLSESLKDGWEKGRKQK